MADKPIHYATHKAIEKGRVCWVEGTETRPTYFVCHPDDFEVIKDGLPGEDLVHLRDYGYSEAGKLASQMRL